MALQTLGTTTTTVLPALRWNPQSNITDLAQVINNIKAQNSMGRISPGAFSRAGRLHFPGRQGFLLLNPGDIVAYDSNGWPIVVSAQSQAAGGTSWVLT